MIINEGINEVNTFEEDLIKSKTIRRLVGRTRSIRTLLLGFNR